MQTLLNAIPDTWGPKRLTGSGALTRTRTGPNEIALTPPAHMALIMLTPQPNREVALGSDRKAIALAPVGGIEIVPAGADLFARWVTAKENMLFLFDERRLAGLAGAEFDKESFDFRPPPIGMADQRALMLARMAREELERGEEANALCLESILVVLASHLLRTYSSLARRRAPLTGGLSPRRLRLVLDYVRENLCASISIVELAAVAGLSPSHFLRAFRKTVGEAPHQYLLNQRVALAERMIVESDLPMEAIASAAGFCGGSHMTVTMKRLRGHTPKQVRRDARGA